MGQIEWTQPTSGGSLVTMATLYFFKLLPRKKNKVENQDVGHPPPYPRCRVVYTQAIVIRPPPRAISGKKAQHRVQRVGLLPDSIITLRARKAVMGGDGAAGDLCIQLSRASERWPESGLGTILPERLRLSVGTARKVGEVRWDAGSRDLGLTNRLCGQVTRAL